MDNQRGIRHEGYPWLAQSLCASQG